MFSVAELFFKELGIYWFVEWLIFNYHYASEKLYKSKYHLLLKKKVGHLLRVTDRKHAVTGAVTQRQEG